MSDYYQNKTHVSCSALKDLWRKTYGGEDPEMYPESLKFGQDVDSLLTEPELVIDNPEAAALADLYRKGTKTPFNIDITAKLQHEFYKTISPFGYPVKFRGKTDIWFHKYKIVEDIKTTKISSKTINSIENAVDHFGYDMQIVSYMILSRSEIGVISFLSRSGWLYQYYVNRGSLRWNKGREKLKKHLELWQNTQL